MKEPFPISPLSVFHVTESAAVAVMFISVPLSVITILLISGTGGFS